MAVAQAAKEINSSAMGSSFKVPFLVPKLIPPPFKVSDDNSQCTSIDVKDKFTAIKSDFQSLEFNQNKNQVNGNKSIQDILNRY